MKRTLQFGHAKKRATIAFAVSLCFFSALASTDATAQTADAWKWQASIYGY